jgi:hypothetical protein
MATPEHLETELQREMRLADAAEAEQMRLDWIAVQEQRARQEAGTAGVEGGQLGAVTPASKDGAGAVEAAVGGDVIGGEDRGGEVVVVEDRGGEAGEGVDDDDDDDTTSGSEASLQLSTALAADFAKEWKKRGTQEERDGFVKSEPEVRGCA